MPTKPRASQAELEHGQAGLRGDRDRHRIGHRQPAGAAEFLLGQKERRQLAQALHGSRRRCWRNGNRARVACQSASGIGRRSRVRARRPPPALQPVAHPARGTQRLVQCESQSPEAFQRSTSARAVRSSSRSQSLSTWRTRPGASAALPGRWVWPWTSAGARRASRPARAHRSASAPGGGEPRRCSLSSRIARAIERAFGERAGEELRLDRWAPHEARKRW